MKKYKFIISFFIIVLIWYLHMSYVSYRHHNHWSKKTSTEVKKIIHTITETNNLQALSFLKNYYLVRGEKYNGYLLLCFRYQNAKDKAYFISYWTHKNEGIKLKECPTEPLKLIEDNNTILDNIIAWIIS